MKYKLQLTIYDMLAQGQCLDVGQDLNCRTQWRLQKDMCTFLQETPHTPCRKRWNWIFVFLTKAWEGMPSWKPQKCVQYRIALTRWYKTSYLTSHGNVFVEFKKQYQLPQYKVESDTAITCIYLLYFSIFLKLH